MFTARLIAYSPAGARLTDLLLDGVSWDAQMPLNDVAALSLNYPSVVDGIGLASEPVELAVEISDGGEWVEPRNARFLTSEVDSDLVAPLDVPGLKFRGLGALLERPLILRESENEGKPYNSDGKRNFLSASAGQIVTSVLNESRARYSTMLQGVTLGFTASTDSNGSAWGKLDSVAYEPGTDLLRILDDLASRGVIDWWMRGRELNIVNGDSMAMDTGVVVPLLDAESAPVRMTHESRATHVAVEGGQSKVWEQPVPGASVPYGAKIIRIANDSITTEGTAGDLIQRQIVQATGSRREYTTSLPLVDAAPFIDFHVGDWVLARTGSVSVDAAGLERVRVHAVTIRWDQSAATVGCDLTLNDRFVDASVRDAKRMQGITHGATQVLGDGGLPSRSDRAIPAAPTGVVGNSLGYWNGAIPLSSVDVSWNAVESDVDGLALNGVDYYEIRVGGQTKRAEGTIVGFDGLQPSRIYDITVRAISSTGISGRWSAPVSVLTDYPLPNLDPPTQPTFRTENAAVEVMWDGMLRGSGDPYAPPRHFSHTLVEVQKVGGAWTRYERDSGWVLVGLTAGDDWRARLIAVDMLGRESDPSPIGTVVVKSAAQEAQVAADAAAQEASEAKADAQAAATRIDTISGELDETAQTAQDAWNLALEATASATQRVNLIKNPTATRGTTTWTSASASFAATTEYLRPGVIGGAQFSFEPVGGVNSYASTTIEIQAESQFVGARANLGRSAGSQYARISFGFRQGTTVLQYVHGPWTLLSDTAVEPVTVTQPVVAGADNARVFFYAAPSASGGFADAGTRMLINAPIAATGGSAEAVGLALTPFFSGDSDDRTDASGILYQSSWSGEPGQSTSIETAYTSAMLEIIAQANAATAAAIAAGQAAGVADDKATQAINAAGGKNKIFRGTTLPGSTVGTAVGDVFWRYADPSLEGPIIGQWTWDGSQWRPSMISSEIIANLTVDKLVVTGGAKFPLAVIDTLVGDDAFFQRAMANQIIVTPGNIIPGVDTILKSDAGWSEFGRNLTDPSRWLQGRVNAETDVPFLVTAGVEYSVEVEVRSSVSGTSFYLRALPRSGQVFPGTTAYIMSDQRVTGTTWNTFTTTWTPEVSGEIVLQIFANHSNGADNPTGYQWFRNPTMIPRIGAIQLKDGVITTPKLATQAVEADKIAVGALDAFQITSPNFQSVATANRGIKWNGNQFVAYNNSGAEMIRLEGNTGEITGVTVTGGVVRTAPSGGRVEISTGGTQGAGRVRVYDSANTHRATLGLSTGGDPGLWMYNASGTETFRLNSTGRLTMWAPNGQESFLLQTENDETFGRAWLYGPNYGGNRSNILMGRSTVDGVITTIVRLNSGQGTDSAYLRVAAGGGWWLGSGTRGRIHMQNASGELLLSPRSGLLSFYNLPGTASTGQPLTMIVGSTGMPSIYRQTSVRASKTHIEDLDVDPYKVLELQPRTFYDRNAWERYANALTVEHDREHDQEPDPEIAVHEGTQYPDRLVGFIAEEVAELFPELVSYDDQGNLAGVQYDRVSGHLLLAVKAILERVEALETKESNNE